MIKRIAALLMCLVLLAATPLSAAAAEPANGTAQSASALQYYASGTITLGSIILRDAVGNELALDYAYSPRASISESISDQLTAVLSNAGFDLPKMNFDYQLMNMQKFFVVKCTDGQALGTMIESLLNPVTIVSGSDVSASDAAASTEAPEDTFEAVGAAEPVDEVEAPVLGVALASASDAAVSGTDVSATDVSATDIEPEVETEATTAAPAADFIVPEAPVITQTSLNSLMLGTASFDVYPTLEQTVANAFPEFVFGGPEYDYLPDVLGTFSGVTMSIDKMNATVSIQPEPEYVERVVFGETFTVLMVSNVAYRYELQRINMNGACNGAAPPKPPVEEIVTPTDVVTTTTTAETTTTTEETTTTTTFETTASTTLPTEEVTTTTESTTTTTESTTTTTAPLIEGGRPAYVSTRWKRLNVRTGPGLNYKIITQLNKGTAVTVLKQDPETGWYNVRLADGTVGWCTYEYITLN